jgi:hypothetical protein
MAHDDDGSQNDRDDRTGGNNGLPPGIAKKDWIPPGIAKQEQQGRLVTANSHTTVNLGQGNATVTLHGNNVTVLGQDGTVAVTGTSTNFDHVRLGNGPDSVSLAGSHNTITLGNGNDAVALGPHSHNDTVTVGSGHDTITTAASDTGNTFRLNGSTASLVLHGTNNKVFISGGTDAITDSPSQSDALKLQVGASGGTVNVSNFAAGGVVDLASDLGFSSGAAAALALTNDGHGGSMLTFANGLGSIDFKGVPLGTLHADNFKVT